MNADETNADKLQLDRRTVLRTAAVTGAAIAISGAAGAPWAGATPVSPSKKRCYVLVIDGCRPDEITPEKTPNLHALRASGRWYPQARSMPIAETLPNHVMMMTGVRPDRGGVPANSVYDRKLKEIRTVGRASDITSPTVLELMRKKRLTSGTVLSKDYLYTVFGTRATYRWEPKPILPVTGHTPDAFTMSALREMITTADPHLVFASFGDIDRMGHSDVTGTSVQALRTTALKSTDTQIGDLITWLKARRTWAQTTIIVVADHSMDWSVPDRVISLTKAFKGNRLLDGKVVIADNGGADVITHIGPGSEKERALKEAAKVARATEGVLSTATTAQLRLGAKAGDLVVYCRSGYRFSDPDLISNPIPGNHGHPATHAIPFFLAGGAVRKTVVSDRAATIDVAPTVARIFDLAPPNGGFDGKPRS